jgi:copper(I)-binding protein
MGATKASKFLIRKVAVSKRSGYGGSSAMKKTRFALGSLFLVPRWGLMFGTGSALGAPARITVEKPWMRYLLPEIPAAGYMTLRNLGDDDVVLTGAASPDCGMLMLHETKEQSGMAMMMQTPGITIPAQGSITLAPGGYHLMCTEPRMKPGEIVPVTLRFSDGSSLQVELPVYGAQGAP